MGRKVKFYQEDGKCPVTEFLDTLSGKTAQKVIWVLKLIEELDRVPGQYIKMLSGTDNIWEVRADLGHDAIRLLGFWDRNSFIVLTNGFQKKTTKTPKNEIAVAEARKKKYQRRKINE